MEGGGGGNLRYGGRDLEGGRKGGWLRRWKGGRVGGRPRPRQPAPRLAGLGPFSLSCCDRPKRGPGPCRPLPCSLPPLPTCETSPQRGRVAEQGRRPARTSPARFIRGPRRRLLAGGRMPAARARRVAPDELSCRPGPGPPAPHRPWLR